MRNVRVVSGVLAALLSSAGMIAAISSAHAVTMQEAGVGAGSTNDALFAIESNRVSIVDRILSNFDGQIKVGANNAASVRASLLGLRADQLLSASLSNSLPDVMQILAEPVAVGPATHRYVAIAPSAAASYALPEAASSFVVRNNDDLSLVGRDNLNTAAMGSIVVGYFVPNVASGAVSVSNSTGVTSLRKDGVGTGSASWIGFTSGGNTAPGANSGVAAGINNQASGSYAFVGAGVSNVASGTSALVIGGFDNQAISIDSLVGAGAGNRATGARSVIVGGGYNLASGNFSFIGGGGRDGSGNTAAGTDPNLDNRAYGRWSFVGGGRGNASGVSGSGDLIRSSTVAGGSRNTASGAQAFIGGGGCNVASGTSAVVAGGGQTDDSVACATFGNTASGFASFVGGGFQNTAAGQSSVALGQGSTASGVSSSVGGGNLNTASGLSSSVGGGSANTASADASIVAGGYLNKASGGFSFVGGGYNNTAAGFSSVALGQSATANNDFSFVWSSGNAYGPSNGSQTFNVAASNGVHLNTDTSLNFGSQYRQMLNLWGPAAFGIGVQGSTLYHRSNSNFAWYTGGTHSDTAFDSGGGAVLATLQVGAGSATVTGNVRALGFTATSDRAAKTDFSAVDAKSVLAKVAALPLSSWAYIAEKATGVRHIGPMAQDFMRAFNVGYDDKSISTVDASGVALTAIKGLSEIVQEKAAQIKRLERELNAIKKKLGM